MRAEGTYRPGLDGVRALAVIAVLAFHDGRLPGGFLGVSVFFTLSGFLITGLLVREHERSARISLRRFYSRRARRLLPAAFLGIVLAAVVVAAVGDVHTARAFRWDGLAALFDVANWRFLLSGHSYVNLFSAPSPLQHYWSLAVEEQFYLLLAPLTALLLWLAKGRRSRLAVMLGVLAAISFADGWLAVRHGVDRAYYGTDTRALEFLVGALVAVWLVDRPLGRRSSRAAAALGVVAVAGKLGAILVARTDQPGLFHGGLLLFACGSAAFVVAACEPGPVRWVCASRPLTAIGLISYGIYVIHWPVFVWLTPARAGFGGWSLTFVRVGITLVLATLSFFFVERPIREGRRVRGRTRWVVPPVGAGACALAAVVVGVGATAGPAAVTFAPALNSAAILSAAPAAAAPVVPAPPTTGTRTTRRAAGTTSKPTAKPNPKPVLQRVLIVGDSVALTLGRGIERWGAARHVAVFNDGKLGCTLLDDATVRGYWGVEYRPPDSCHVRDEWSMLLTRFRPDVVVVLFGAWDVYDASWPGTNGFISPGTRTWDAHYSSLVTAAFDRLHATGAHVLWVLPPCFGAAPGADTSAPWYNPARVDAISAIYTAVVNQGGGRVTDVAHRMGCPVDLNTRPDGVHYSDPGADTVAAALGPQIVAANR